MRLLFLFLHKKEWATKRHTSSDGAKIWYQAIDSNWLCYVEVFDTQHILGFEQMLNISVELLSMTGDAIKGCYKSLMGSHCSEDDCFT